MDLYQEDTITGGIVTDSEHSSMESRCSILTVIMSFLHFGKSKKRITPTIIKYKAPLGVLFLLANYSSLNFLISSFEIGGSIV